MKEVRYVAASATGSSSVPVEIYACNFREGKGPDDLNAVTAKWNAWMDDEGVTDYFAALMYPNYSSDLGFDVGWIGGWRDGNAMGAGTDRWVNEGGELNAGFAEVVDCMSHTNFVSTRMKDPGDSGDDDNTIVLGFSNCTIEEGKTFEDYEAAQKKWNAYAEEHGFKGGAWVMWPVWGNALDTEWDFKSVISWPNYATVGANYQLMVDGHWSKSQEIWDGLVDCDSRRIYTTYVVRSMADEDDE